MCGALSMIIETLYPTESKAVTIATFSKDRVQEQVLDTNTPADEYVTRRETQYFTQVPRH